MILQIPIQEEKLHTETLIALSAEEQESIQTLVVGQIRLQNHVQYVEV
jgi:hypothetical protein